VNKKWRPRWRAAFIKGRGGNGVLSAAFLAARRSFPDTGPLCEAVARSTGKRCGQPARRGTTRCKHHGLAGALDRAAEAEAKAYGRPVIVTARNPRNKALGKLGSEMEWPEGVPKRADLLVLGPLARGRLFEAWLNRLTAPDVWEYELTRERVRT
jgi:hypothetical protein